MTFYFAHIFAVFGTYFFIKCLSNIHQSHVFQKQVQQMIGVLSVSNGLLYRTGFQVKKLNFFVKIAQYLS